MLPQLHEIQHFLQYNTMYKEPEMLCDDELVFDVEKQEFTQVAEIVKFHMEQSLQLSVPIVANIKVGKNWLELEPLDP